MKRGSTLFSINGIGMAIFITGIFTGLALGANGAVNAQSEWTWVSGSYMVDRAGIYGTKGTPDAGNIPGARQGSVSWVHSGDDLWLFGGWGYGSEGTYGSLNDLWGYDITSGEWTWVSGSNIMNQTGTYGIKETPAVSNIPGGRGGGISWVDSNGDFWLFGGKYPACFDWPGWTYDGFLNDLWRYDTSSGEWTWMSGSDNPDQKGTYGTKGKPAAANIPGARWESTSWVDTNGDFWLFGGYGPGNILTQYLNDLWRYNNTSGEWTWMSGSDARTQAGTYGTKGTPAASNIPGSRKYPISWVDSNGDFWLFGGQGLDSASSIGELNDLWRYNTTSGEWTWMSGSDIMDQGGTYGTKGMPAASNVPGARYASFFWVDSGTELWLFGGYGHDSTATNGDQSDFNDLWRYDIATGEWTWMSGSDIGEQSGVYGTKGIPEANNIPGNRDFGNFWVDSKGEFWLFGGVSGAANSTGQSPLFNDLWHFGTTTPTSVTSPINTSDIEDSSNTEENNYSLIGLLVLVPLVFRRQKKCKL